MKGKCALLIAFLCAKPVWGEVQKFEPLWEVEVLREVLWEETTPFGIQAIVSRQSAGATTSFLYLVEIRDSASEPTEYDLVFKADKTTPIVASWADEDTLEICYTDARIWQYTNFRSILINGDYKTFAINLKQQQNC
ncbi:MAG: hypothetical protein ABJD51_12695 [Roseobacter sp.]